MGEVSLTTHSQNLSSESYVVGQHRVAIFGVVVSVGFIEAVTYHSGAVSVRSFHRPVLSLAPYEWLNSRKSDWSTRLRSH